MRSLEVSVEPEACAADVDAVHAGLRAFNRRIIGDPAYEDLRVLLRDEQRAVVGGLVGHVRWRWAYVEKLWIADAHRGGGYGRRLMAAAEAQAVAAGCIGIYLDTFEYQARPFYEKLGYEVFGTLEGFPPGYRQYFLAKRFPASIG